MLLPSLLAMRQRAADSSRDLALVLVSTSLLILAVLWWFGW